MPNQAYDVIIIGAGVVGSLIARALSRYRLRILLLDKASDVGEGTTKANTAIVHAGYDAKPGTLKARLNVAGNAMYDQVCAELDVDFDRCGTYVVAVRPEDWDTLDALRQRGAQNGVPGLSLIDADEMRRREPSITDSAVGALFAETGGIVDPFGLCFGAAESAVLNGVELALETVVTGLMREGRRVTGVRTNRGDFAARWVVIAAGLWADDLMQQAGLDGFTITPRKGEYFVLDRVAAETVRGVLFPCPTPVSKGILVTRTIHGNVMLGPNANDVASKDDVSVTADGLNEVLTGALALVPTLNTRQIIRTFAGLRAAGSTGDFVIECPRDVDGLCVLAGIESPGLTASPAIAAYVVELLREAGLALVERPDYQPMRRAIPRFSTLSRQEQAELIARDARYGNVVCRCETVTEGEIVAACHAPIPARTYDAVKRRTRCGTGRCQGAFDLPLVVQIMARELGVSPLEITKKGGESRFLLRETKQVAE
ncbi:MAG: NAD(P)/FAD-dependent oxidoreductase [Chloroflexi bacterium]|jgi:glycerol-3-phosphate dehydrogenase|nr:NAD(P)/FAD-dependent oxidoreductase [Chloroflexota bacterium]